MNLNLNNLLKNLPFQPLYAILLSDYYIWSELSNVWKMGKISY